MSDGGNPYHDPKDGKFTSGPSGGGAKAGKKWKPYKGQDFRDFHDTGFSGQGSKHGQPSQHPDASANAHEVHNAVGKVGRANDGKNYLTTEGGKKILWPVGMKPKAGGRKTLKGH